MSYFHFHTDDINFDKKLSSRFCKFIKNNGQRCRNRCVIGLDYCHIHTKYVLKLQIKKSTIENAGKGLFAYGNPNEIIFKKNSKICDYNGQLISEETLNGRYDQYTAPYAIRLHKNKYEDASTVRGIGSTANHSNIKRKINARLSVKRDNTAQLMSTKDIKGGQEIFVDYGDDYLFQDEDDNICTSTNRNKYKC
jgi:hypothetical protein